MKIRVGVPAEIKDGETRVSMTPSLCRRVVALGGQVLVQRGAGVRAGFADSEYREAGAQLTPSADRVYARSELIVKVKEPLPEEFPRLRPEQTVFTYLHLAANPALTRCLLEKRILGIAYETVEGRDGSFPLLKPMSQIAGRLAGQIGAHFLESQNGGAGVLLGGIPGTAPGHAVIIGAGNSGAHACRMVTGMGARVTLLDIDARQLERIDSEYGARVVTLLANPSNVEKAVSKADLLIGAVLVPGARAPRVVTRRMVRSMRPGSVIVDIAIDQGGCIETVRATSHHQPTYLWHGVVHYAVPNMPALVGRSSTIALTQATEPFITGLVEHGVAGALAKVPGLAQGVNTREGRLA